MPVRQTIWTTAGRGRLFDSILDTVGDTPTIRINNLGVDGATIYVKAEFFNPAASVKDRLALNIIEEGERSGALKPGQTVVEATSGNTGIGLAMVCAQKGYPLVVTMADSFSDRTSQADAHAGRQGRADAARAQGLRHVREGRRTRRSQRLVPRAPVRDRGQRRHSRGDDGARDHQRFRRIAARLVRDRLRHRRNRRRRRAECCAASGPKRASSSASRPTRSSSAAGVRRTRAADGAPAASHPPWEPHPIQGWTPDFIPERAAGGDRPPSLRRSHPDRRRRGNEMGEGARPEGGDIHRHLRGLDLRRRAPDRRNGAGRVRHPVHAARHRRALHDDAAVRRDRSRDERGGDGAFAIDADGSVSCCSDAGRSAANARIAERERRRRGNARSGRLGRGAGAVAAGSSRTPSAISAMSANARSGGKCRRTCGPPSTRRCRERPDAAGRGLSRGRGERDGLSDGQHPSALLVLVHGLQQLHRSARRLSRGDPGLQPRRRQSRRRADGPAGRRAGARTWSAFRLRPAARWSAAARWRTSSA